MADTMKLSALILDPSAQPRVKLDDRVIDEYAEAMREGAAFPSVVAYGTARKAWLGDGWHRYHAAQAAGLTELPVDLRSGNLDDAIWYSVTTNAEHGLRRTNADKNRAVVTALTLNPRLADSEIARHCSVHHSLVSTVRRRLEGEGTIEPEEIRETTRGGERISQRQRRGRQRAPAMPEGTAATDAAPEGTSAAGEPPIDEGTAVAVIQRYRRLRLFAPARAAVMLAEGEEAMTAAEVGAIGAWFIEVGALMETEEAEEEEA
jgi:hypothetical protein